MSLKHTIETIVRLGNEQIGFLPGVVEPLQSWHVAESRISRLLPQAWLDLVEVFGAGTIDVASNGFETDNPVNDEEILRYKFDRTEWALGPQTHLQVSFLNQSTSASSKGRYTQIDGAKA